MRDCRELPAVECGSWWFFVPESSIALGGGGGRRGRRKLTGFSPGRNKDCSVEGKLKLAKPSWKGIGNKGALILRLRRRVGKRPSSIEPLNPPTHPPPSIH